MSANGTRVFFSTGEALVADDSNGRVDAYEYDATTGTVHLLSTGKDASDSYFMDASSGGEDAFILTRQQLVGWDTDQNYDIYDVRVDGGFPEPVAPVPTCSGDGCRGPSPTPPSSVMAATATTVDPGNLALPPAIPPLVKSLSNAQKLKRALHACAKRPRRLRGRCRASARHRFADRSSRSRRSR
jgi:hypothetical protein